MNKKDFNKLFAPINEAGTQIWVKTGVKELSEEIVEMTIALSGLEFIKYIRVCDSTLKASSHNYPKRPKVPIVHSGAHHAIGIEIFYDLREKSFNLNDLNPVGEPESYEMVYAVLDKLPTSWRPVLIIYLNDKFWNEIQEKYNNHKWFTV